MDLHVTGSCGPDDAAHLVVCIHSAEERALYSHKVVMPIPGSLTTAGEQIGRPTTGDSSLRRPSGDYPRPMKCHDFGSPVSVAPAGRRRRGFNLTHNKSAQPGELQQNAIWIATGSTASRR